MASNAPYYQIRSGQLVTSPRSTNTTPSPFVAEDDAFEPPTGDATPPHALRTASLPEHVIRQASKDTPGNTSDENHNLAELLEAATSAADQAAEIMNAHDAVKMHDTDSRKRVSSSLAGDGSALQNNDIAASKRRRVDVPMDPELQSTGHGSRGNSKSTSVPPPTQSLLQDARAAGVHSAAALFRRTSEKSTTRKYTRPPMSKLFMSLQLSPEGFLQLQAQAKTYMLDTTHPERQSCVGNRGKGDTDMVKLRLFKCVKDFLDDGSGEQFFGEYVEKPGEKDAMEAARALGEDRVSEPEERLIWPRDGNKIISLVTPLMRRMVTNERQRKYAIETRKGGAKRKDKEDSAEAAVQHVSRSPSSHDVHGDSVEHHFAPASGMGASQVTHSSHPASPSVATPTTPSQVPIASMAHVGVSTLPLPTAASVTPHLSNINIFLVLASSTMSDGTVKPGIKLDEKRIVPESSNQLTDFSWDDLQREVINLLNTAKVKYPAIRNHVVAQSATSGASDNLTENLRELAAAANAMQGENTNATTELSEKKSANASLLPRYVVKTVGPSGWENIEETRQWKEVLARRSVEVWADGVVNVLVELVDIPVGVEGKEVDD